MKTAVHFFFLASLLTLCLANHAEKSKNDEPKRRVRRALYTTPKVMTPPAEFFDVVPDFVGCFNDRPAPYRALPILYANYRNSIDWSDMSKTVKKCADEARKKGFNDFAVQFYGECWSGEFAFLTYNKYGTSKNCGNGVGRHWTNAFYSFKHVPKAR